jgi:hypothetical protein
MGAAILLEKEKKKSMLKLNMISSVWTRPQGPHPQGVKISALNAKLNFDLRATNLTTLHHLMYRYLYCALIRILDLATNRKGLAK